MNKTLAQFRVKLTIPSAFTFDGFFNKTTFVCRFTEVAINNQISDIPSIGFFASRLTGGCCCYLTLTDSFLPYITFTVLIIVAHISAVRKRDGITKTSFVEAWASIHINSTCTVYLRWFIVISYKTQVILRTLMFLSTIDLPLDQKTRPKTQEWKIAITFRIWCSIRSRCLFCKKRITNIHCSCIYLF